MAKQDSVNVDELLDSDELSAIHAGRQGDLHSAVMRLSVRDTLNLLALPVNPNNALGQQSFITYAMNKHVNSPALRKDAEKKAASQSICFALVEHGARLGHVPIDNKNTPCALRDSGIWHDATFSAQILFRAMDYALTHNRTVPYLSINNLYTPLDTLNPQRGAETVLKAFEDVARVQQKVADWLDKPVDDLTTRVAGKLPAEQRNFWADAAARAGKPSILSF